MSGTTSREPRLFEKTLANLADAWREVSAGAARTVGRIASADDRVDPSDLRTLMRACVESRGGEVSARGRAAELGRRYLAMDRQSRYVFFDILAREFACSDTQIAAAVDAYLVAADRVARREAETLLRRKLTPPRQTVLRQFNAMPEGTKFLVDMRADLIDLLETNPELRLLDEDLREILTAWFDVGLLDFHAISWQSSAALLEKLIAYEAVHEIRDWDDLRDRLDSDRRCYALFHPRMPQEPLAFIEVALTRTMAGSIQGLLNEAAPPGDPNEARAAVFYSISNTQRGLLGISFGEYLIKQVVGQLHGELPQLHTFATLSPIPCFRSWLSRVSPAMVRALTDEDERNALTAAAGINDPHTALKRLVERMGEGDDNTADSLLNGPMIRLCARYFLDRRSDGAPVDPVARFHLKNGARLERINLRGDVSAKGIRQAAGLMVNYRYDRGEMETNHEAYVRAGRIALSNEITGLLRGWKDPDGTPLRQLAMSGDAAME